MRRRKKEEDKTIPPPHLAALFLEEEEEEFQQVAATQPKRANAQTAHRHFWRQSSPPQIFVLLGHQRLGEFFELLRLAF